VFDEQDKLQ